jgi:CBS domain-containing protein/ribosomal protein S27AE
LARVKDVMTTNVPRVKSSATVLESAETMNRANSTGVAVVNEDDQVVGLITALRLLREFFALNKKPEDVKASQVMAPFYRISPNASTKEAARKILAHSVTRLGVFEDDEFVGWVSLTDLTREFSRRRLIDALTSHGESEDTEFLCPNCRGAFLSKVTDDDGEIHRWACPNCRYSL